MYINDEFSRSTVLLDASPFVAANFIEKLLHALYFSILLASFNQVSIPILVADTM